MADPFWRPSTPESRESWLRNLYTPPVIPHPPSVPPEVGGVGDVAGPPVSLHDYPAMAARPLSPNLEDLRFQTPPDLWSRIWSGLGGAPPSHMMPLVQRGLQVLGGGMPGPAPTGSPYPTAPTPYAGTSIQSQRLDPNTIMLSNQPPLQMPAPQPAPTEQPAYPTPAAETYSTQQPGPTLRTVTDPAYQAAIEGMNRSDARREYRDLNRLLQNPDWSDEDVLPTLSHLLNTGWLDVTADDFDTKVRLPQSYKARLIELIDHYRPMILSGGPGYQTQIMQGQPITEQDVAERYGGSTPSLEDVARRYGGSVP